MNHPYVFIGIVAIIVAVSLFIGHRYRLSCIEHEIVRVLEKPESVNHPDAIRARIARERTRAGYKFDLTEERCRPPLSLVVRGLNRLSRKGRVRIKDRNIGGKICPDYSLA